MLITIRWWQQVQMSFCISIMHMQRELTAQKQAKKMLTWVSSLAIAEQTVFNAHDCCCFSSSPARMVFLNIWGCLHKLFKVMFHKMYFYGRSRKMHRSVFMKVSLLNKSSAEPHLLYWTPSEMDMVLHRVKSY
jgi:hypothetical protein